MQPTLILSAAQPGILYLNGRFAGELSADLPLFRPVGSRGPVYLEYRPLCSAYRPITRKLVFSGGAPMEESADEAEDMHIILWPGGALEIEFSTKPEQSRQIGFSLEGRSFILDGTIPELLCEGARICTLPAGAQVPELYHLENGAVLIGYCSGGRYMLAMDSELRMQTGFLQAQQLDVERDGRIRAISAPGDLVGHATLETWRLTPGGLLLASAEPAWAHGAPRWPATPDETARAAVEAALAGLDAEAENYLTPALRSRMPLHGVREKCDLCLEMKYLPAGGRPCVGLLRLEGAHMARVQPMYYHAVASGGPQGPWQLDSVSFS